MASFIKKKKKTQSDTSSLKGKTATVSRDKLAESESKAGCFFHFGRSHILLVGYFFFLKLHSHV
ncbi:hypothetical protein AB205_0047700 [Aquarana catesbeiana]|uniref:Uncharacterized protein n=1 Tax=Aquarana catesbeiana TaxID=8400 RepID=A0A2G9SJK9_AQUCT|nr:hypothetical protein AB205_0047700 [Aquarana catesbeiana]